jgi:hypothetical protein
MNYTLHPSWKRLFDGQKALSPQNARGRINVSINDVDGVDV